MNVVTINKLFREYGRTLGSVESFTGGLFAREITKVSGASHFFKGALVTYASEEKNRILGISYDVIDQYGVVSREVAGIQTRSIDDITIGIAMEERQVSRQHVLQQGSLQVNRELLTLNESEVVIRSVLYVY